MTTPDLARDLARGYTLPADWYTDPAVLRLERDRIFARTWQYVGRTEQVREPGDFFASPRRACPGRGRTRRDGRPERVRQRVPSPRPRGRSSVTETGGRSSARTTHGHMGSTAAFETRPGPTTSRDSPRTSCRSCRYWSTPGAPSSSSIPIRRPARCPRLSATSRRSSRRAASISRRSRSTHTANGR